MNKKYFRITPNDVLFFRDTSNFGLGDYSSVHESLIMPSPSVFYGAIFSELLRMINPEASGNTDLYSLGKDVICQLKGLPRNKLEEKLLSWFIIENIFVQYDGSMYFSAPLDIFEYDGRIKYSQYEDGVAVLPADGRFEQIEDKLIKVKFLERYADENTSISLSDIDGMVYKEHKLGIKLNKNRMAEEGMLYSQNQIRFDKKFSFIVEASVDESIFKVRNSTLKLGGESKTAKMEILDKIAGFEKAMSSITNNDEYTFYKVIATTPWVLNNSYVIDNEKINNEVKSYDIITGKLQNIGGFDMLENSHKKSVKALRAGTVLYVELNEKMEMSNFSDFIGQNINWLQNDIYNYSTRGFNKYIVIPGGLNE